MINRSGIWLSCVFGLAATVASLGTPAQQLIDQRGQRGFEQPYAGGVTLDAAVALVQNRFRAKAVKTETVNERGHRVYYIRLLNAAGRVWTVRVDAETGNIN